MKKFWCFFFAFWPITAIVVCLMSPSMNWWFPGESVTPLGKRIDGLFYLILYIVTAVFIGTQIALAYVLFRGIKTEGKQNVLFSHGSHNLEVMWTIVPTGVLLFISLYQLDVWADFRMKSHFPEEAVNQPIAEVTARQFEWRIRYPDPGRKFHNDLEIEQWLKNPQPDDLYTVNDLHVPSIRPVLIHLRSGDVQHSFFAPKLRVKQDAVPGLVIPIWFEITRGGKYELLCAELCGWGHYKMRAQIWAQPAKEFRAYLEKLKEEQFYDGVPDKPESPVAVRD